MKPPVVTVLMPVFNGARHLRAAIESVTRQSFCDFELLVIDDGSTDETAQMLDGFGDPRLRVLRNERNLGLVPTLNRGLAEARGEWIARQDADDLSAPGRLAAQLGFVQGNPSVPLVGTDAWLIDDNGRPRGRWRTGGHADLVQWDLCFRAPFAHSSALFRRGMIVDRFGGYRDLPACEDLDLWQRVAEKFPVVTLRQPLVKYRLHGASIMAGSAHDSARARAVREILERQIESVAPGVSLEIRSQVASPWSGPLPVDWNKYCEAVKAVEWGFLRGRRPGPGFGRMKAELAYALYFRAVREGRGAEFLRALLNVDGALWRHLPWIRMAVTAVRK
jgi:hypothetical protein